MESIPAQRYAPAITLSRALAETGADAARKTAILKIEMSNLRIEFDSHPKDHLPG
jgi:hypothetical protein